MGTLQQGTEKQITAELLFTVHKSERAWEAQVSVRLGQRRILPFRKRKAV